MQQFIDMLLFTDYPYEVSRLKFRIGARIAEGCFAALDADDDAMVAVADAGLAEGLAVERGIVGDDKLLEAHFALG